MWSEKEAREINTAIDASYDRVRRLNISADYVVKKISQEHPELYLKTVEIESALTPNVPFKKAMAMLAAWEGTWKQIEMKINRRK